METNLIFDILFPLFSIVIPVFATVYTVNNRIKNEKKENHRPYIVLDKVIDLDEIDIDSYYLTPVGRNFIDKHKEIDYINIESKNDIIIKLLLKNIGYGVATNIKFYNLLEGDQVHGTQATNYDRNQKLFTTLDMQAGEEKSVQARIINFVNEVDNILIEDHIRMICVYKDLNDNIYNFIISINAKGNNHYDFFAYQPASKSYRIWQKENNKQFKHIMKKYSNL